jgi:hypothetical protein
MPTCTPEAVLAAGAVFQQDSPLDLLRARVALLWLQNGSSGTAASLYATGKAFDGCTIGQLDYCLTTLLWECDSQPAVSGIMASAAAYQGVNSPLQAMCATISEWIEQGSAGTPSTVASTAKQFEGLSWKQLAIIELVLLMSIYSKSFTPATLLAAAQSNGLLKFSHSQLMILDAWFYCQLS